MNAYERGWDDAERGASKGNNPYRHFSVEWYAWRNGWRELNTSLHLDVTSPELHELIRVQA